MFQREVLQCTAKSILFGDQQQIIIELECI